jgi:large conductance mechanosensitive channel
LKKSDIFLNKKCIFISYSYGMRAEFMEFIATYNVIWVAIWLLIATKVGEWTKSFIEDFITPLILTPIFKKLKIEKLEDLSWRWVLYGKLIARTIDFIIIALLVFFVVKKLGVQA